LNRDFLEVVRKNLPKTPGISGRDELINSAVMVLLVPVGNTYHLLFEKRAKSIAQAGEICFPGGMFDKKKDKNTLDTALRETYEELNLPRENISIIGRLDTIVAIIGQVIDVYVGVSDLGTEKMEANQEEVEEIFTIPISFFKENPPEKYQTLIKQYPYYIDKESGEKIVLLPSEELGLPEKYRKPWLGHKYNLLAYRTAKGTIWGVTARIVNDFINKINF